MSLWVWIFQGNCSRKALLYTVGPSVLTIPTLNIPRRKWMLSKTRCLNTFLCSFLVRLGYGPGSFSVRFVKAVEKTSGAPLLIQCEVKWWMIDENILGIPWGCENLYCGPWAYEEFEHAFSHLSKHIKSFLVDQEACDPKKDLRVKDVREYLKLVLDTDDLDPPINRKGTLVDAWDNHYAPLLRELGEMDWLSAFMSSILKSRMKVIL